MFEDYTKKISSFYRRNDRMPGYKEIMSLCGFKSKNSVYKLINKMVDRGLIYKDPSGRLSPRSLLGQIKVLGSVQAGMPTQAEEQGLDSLNLNDFILENTSSVYLLTVSGDSMIDAGIHEGDLVVVEKEKQAKVGDIVVACVDGDWTLKYLRQKNGHYYLQPANESFSDIYPEGQMEIGGIVRGVIRKYA